MGVFLGNMVIENGETDSTSIGGRILRTIRSIEIHGPATLTGVITVQSADQLAETSFTPIQSGGVDIVVTASKVLVMTVVPGHALRVQSGSAEGDERTFPVFGEENPHQ